MINRFVDSDSLFRLEEARILSENSLMASTLANRYLGPDDLTSLPTTLDAKSSPLAMLAKTCSSIGADVLPPNQKSLIPPLEKPSKHRNSERCESVSSDKNGLSESLRSNSAGSVETRISFKPYETKCSSSASSGKSEHSRDHHDSSRSNSVNVINGGRSNKERSVSGGSSGSGGDGRSTADRDHRSPKLNHNNNHDSSSPPCNTSASRLNSSVPSDRGESEHRLSNSSSNNNGDDKSSINSADNSSGRGGVLSGKHNHDPSSSKVSPLSSTAISYTSSGSTELSKSQLTALTKSDSLPASCKTSSSLQVTGCLNGLNGYPGLTSSPASLPHHLGADLLSASSHYPAALLSPYLTHHQAAALSSLKAAHAAAAQAASMCRDGPYCKQCQFTAALGMSCNTGPCNGHPMQQTAANSSAAAAAAASFLPPFAYNSFAAMAASNAAAAASGSALRVCNWASCGKTFTNSEDFNQHVKTHLSSSSAAAVAAAAVAGAGSPLSGLNSFYPPHSLPSTYPSHLTARAGSGAGGPTLSQLEAFRFHPYKVPGSGLTQSLASGMPTPSPASHIPGLTGALPPSYYQTYGLYNGRIQ